MGALTSANNACMRLAHIAVGDRIVDRIDSDDQAQVEAAFGSEPGTTFDLRVRFIVSDRHIRMIGVVREACDASVEVVCSLIDVTAAKHHNLSLRHRADHDQLTGLLNRTAIEAELNDRLSAARADTVGSRVTALFLDLDGFKDINDAYGHQLGDVFLSTIAERLHSTIRQGDSLGRLGGDEFLILTSASADGTAAGRLAQRLIDEVSRPIPVGPSELRPRMSIGIAIAADDSTSQSLLADADLAMYEAKIGSENIAFATSQTRERVNLRVGIERDLASAMETHEVGFHLQVIRLLESTEPLGAEALVRWTHPTLGPIPPQQLIERAEAIGRIGDFTVWGLDVVCGQLATIRSTTPLFADKGFGVNATIRQLAMPGYVDLHFETLNRHGLRPQDIIVEVTEYEAVGRGGAAEATIVELANLGVPIALDDFGVGYTALDYLTRLPVHVVKVDRTLICGIDERPAARVVLQGLVSMAADLGFETLAEGIETRSELAVCIDIGMQAGQGYLLGRPKPLADFEATDALWTPPRA